MEITYSSDSEGEFEKHVDECFGEFCPSILTGQLTNYIAGFAELLFAASCGVNENWPPNAGVKDGDKFDFVVVGAGSAGCVVANRLSENKNWNVLLVEAGDDPPKQASVPLFHANLRKTKYDWQYSTVNDGYASQGMVTGSAYWEKGKMLGGTSSLSAMVYIRGNPQDYEQWKQQGNEDWGWDVALKYFIKSEDMQDSTVLSDPNSKGYHGTNGSMHVTRFNYPDRNLVNALLDSYSELDLDILNDLNGPSQLGVGVNHGTVKKGQRESSATAFLNTIPDRNNLKILKNTLVSNIIIDPVTKIAKGIQVILSSGKSASFYANKEVILSAGSIGSPQILMLSGVGPEEHLNSLGIQVQHNLPVGEGSYDHVSVPILITTDPRSNFIETSLDATVEAAKYCFNRKGMLAGNGIPAVMAFFAVDNKTYPDFQTETVVLGQGSPALAFCTNSFGYSDEACASLVKLNLDNDLYYILVVLLHPKSKGKILLKTKNSKDSPLLYANYFSDASDLDMAVTAMRKVASIANTTFFKSLNAKVGRMASSVCDKLEYDTDEYLKCIALQFGGSTYHNVGTVRMGPSSDSSSVVDSKCKVHGIEKLRVIDSSVMPYIVSGNTHAVTVMVAERVSDLIKEEYLL